jgi:predicted nucleotidyltransferase
MTPEITNLPNETKSELETFLQKTLEFSASNLVSVYLFGGLAKEEFDGNNSDINLLILLKETNPASLDLLNKALQDSLFKIVLAPFIITADELENAADLFPVKFLDIKRNHILLHGPDLLAKIQINNDLLKRNTRRELKNILFRLNQLYVFNSQTPEILGAKIKHLLPGLLIHINIINFLDNNVLYTTKEEIIEHAVKQLNLDADFLQQLHQYKRNQISILNPEIISLYGKFMNLVKETSTKADKQ